jgi:hypothetical protein
MVAFLYNQSHLGVNSDRYFLELYLHNPPTEAPILAYLAASIQGHARLGSRILSPQGQRTPTSVRNLGGNDTDKDTSSALSPDDNHINMHSTSFVP